MARRPEKDRSRGRRSEASLDWLKESSGRQPAAQPRAAAPTAAQQNQVWPTDNGRHRPIPPPSPTPTDSGPLPLSRRAARAARQAEEQAEQRSQQPAASPAQPLPARPAAPPPAPLSTPSRQRGSRAKDSTPVPAQARPPRRRRVAIWLTLAALLLALWAGTIFIDSGNFILAGLASIAPLVTLIAVPVVAIGVGSKHLVATAIAVVAALLPWTVVTGYLTAGPGPTSVGADSTLRVMSVDGAQGRASAQAIVQLARIYSANIVVVTQLTSQLAHDLTVDGLNVMGPAQWVKVPDGGSNGTGLWSDQKIDELQPIDQLSRPAVDGTIEAGLSRIGITVVQLNGEPMRPNPSWHADLSWLARRNAGVKPGFIVGDLDASPWQPAFRKLVGAGWRDASDVVGQGLRPTWPSWSPIPLTPLDHVLVSPGLGVTSADTLKVPGSDHRALIVTLVVPQAASAGD